MLRKGENSATGTTSVKRITTEVSPYPSHDVNGHGISASINFRGEGQQRLPRRAFHDSSRGGDDPAQSSPTLKMNPRHQDLQK